jgi:NAD(P)-dependent dehydrogenase (short-subunit alcohol dehydrogenase family)
MTTVYITGASAGLGRAIAHAFSTETNTVGLIARETGALEETAAELPGPSAWASADVSSYTELEDAAARLESRIGPPDIWINNAMATLFSGFRDITPEEFARVCNVTFLGSVHGLQIALRSMTPRGHGHIIQIGSTLAYRSIPLQAPYCAAKFAIRGAVDALRCELIHDRSPVRLTTAHMPAINTPQFDWAGRHIAQNPQPLPPIYAPEACAKAVLWAAKHPHMREVWVGKPTLAGIIGNKLAPGLMDHYMARNAYEAQYETPADTEHAQGNLFEAQSAGHRMKGRFGDREIDKVFWIGISARREIALLVGLLLLLGAILGGLWAL